MRKNIIYMTIGVIILAAVFCILNTVAAHALEQSLAVIFSQSIWN